ncbi:acyl-CoA esterase [Oceanibacterium hippocampi]|uniref:Acyl-CoA esterase n=2 Tax=Oceanibacterium hippocampi TaxID=745714 RepID=A0A1Y5SD37_9PROT|nr:acyl-CoA esterase [Oceanibacterium hippocampi]
MLSGGAVETRWIGPPPDRASTLVFLHEGLGAIGMWRDFPDRLAARTGMGALVYSRFGYGGSDACALPRPLGYMHDEAAGPLPELLDAFAVERAVLFGHSDGGSIALIHAGDRPHPSLRALALEAAHVFVEDVSVASIAAAKEAYESADLRARLARHHGDNVDCAFRGWNDAWLDPAFRAWNLEAFLPAIRVPALVIQGRDDEYGTARQVDAIAAGMGGRAETLMLDACGHSPHRDQPDRVIAAVAGFLERHAIGG